MAGKFRWKALERKWQKKWDWAKVNETDPALRRPKYFVTAAYPYPNSPQHIGHGRTYTLADVNARYHRMRGFHTLFPVGFHYTGTPVFAMSKRLRENDPEIVKTFTSLYGVPQNRLEELKDPLKMARYFHQEISKGMHEMGFSIDFRREFTTVDPLYSRFIEWHFRKLKSKGLITIGTHQVGWCPNDKGPVGQHDTKGDVDPEIGEVSVVKFSSNGVFYPTATLRPETIFGVTNLWVKPGTNYVEARVDGENWIVSPETVEKLQHQNHGAEVVRQIPAEQLFWKTVHNPVNNSEVPILPGEFVEAANGTGIVMSVPGHAPYDYQALSDLKSKPTLSEEETRKLKAIEPISIIQVEKNPAIPAEEMVRKFKVSSQNDPHLEEATRDLYSKEFHRGVMSENTGSYAGMPVAKAREAVVQDLSKTGQITRIFEIMNRPVICRCGTECIVHILENQWFINYGDADWKRLAHECLDAMKLFPEESRSQYNYTVDWLKEKACARKVGLGTRLPWDKDWVIESLSDSVVYMAYYILSKFISENWLVFKKFEKDPSRLQDEFFDFVFLGEGDATSVGRDTGVPPRVVKAIRKEFLYFYPIDMRHSAKDLVPSHLSFYIFHHAALFPRELWPKGIVANGFVLMEGAKMSKSMENIAPLRQAIENYGADPVRIGVLATAELGQDTDFSEALVLSMQDRLLSLITQAKKLRRVKPRSRGSSPIDKWMLNRLNLAIRSATEAMEKLRVREVVNYVLYQLDNDLSWYERRLGSRKPSNDSRAIVLRRILEDRARMLAPVAPHTSEEVWSILGNKGLVTSASWPQPDERRWDAGVEQAELVLRDVLDDTSEILKTTGLAPKRVIYYTAADWKWKVYVKALEASADTLHGNFFKEVMADSDLRKLGKQAADYAGKAVQQVRRMPEQMRKTRLQLGPVSEKRIIEEGSDFLGKELHSKVEVWREGDVAAYDPKGKASLAEPYRPAIFIE